MTLNEDYVNYIKDQLSQFGEFETKNMFGGVGFFREGKMFGMIGNNVFRLKVDESNQGEYLARGMTPYHSSDKKKGMPYWEVPTEVIEDRRELAIWANKSFTIAMQSK